MKRVLAALVLLAVLGIGLEGCAPQSEEARSTQEAGGTIPWNRPSSWEGGGALGSQMSQRNQGSGSNF
jgi:hypothetical protein